MSNEKQWCQKHGRFEDNEVRQVEVSDSYCNGYIITCLDGEYEYETEGCTVTPV